MNKKIIIWIGIILLLFNLVTALGIRPSKTMHTFEKGQDFSGEFWVVNNDAQAITTTISVEGGLSTFVTIQEKELHFRENEDAKAVHFVVKLPSVVPAGISSANIVVERNLAQTDLGTISSKVIVKHKIIVEGPYPDKYIENKLNFRDDGGKITLISEVENRGKLNLSNVQTTFYINDEKQTRETLATDETNLKTKENKVLSVQLAKNQLEQGEFKVSAITTYDDQEIEVQKKLIIGKPEVEVTYFDRYLKAKTINQYTLELLNKWNKEVENVFVDVKVTQNGEVLDTFRTKSLDLAALVRERIQDYYNARNREPGTYNVEMTVNYWNTYAMEKQVFQTELLGPDEQIPPPAPLTGKAVETKSAENTPSTLPWGWIIAGLLLILIIFYVIYRYAHRDEYGDNAL